jgi:hypothetical protein
MSEVTKIHTIDGSTVTVGGNFIKRLNEQPNITTLQSFDWKTMVNLDNVAYMEVVEVADDD